MNRYHLNLNNIANALIAIVWLVNGVYCKMLDQVPRHRLIVAEILGEEHATTLTQLIGFSEVLVAVWIVSGIRTRLSAIFQMVVVAVMNILEFVLVPDLLLFGRLNIAFASLFILFIALNEFVLRKSVNHIVTH